MTKPTSAVILPTQQAILNAIPQLTPDALEAYSQMASSNYLFPQVLVGDKLIYRKIATLPDECNAPKYANGFGGVPAYSYVIRFTMIRDDDPYGQGIPAGTVGYWTHDGQGCHIDSQNQIHGIRWVGHSSSLAITKEQQWTADLLLFGAYCGWPTNWNPVYNGYVNVLLNSVWSMSGLQSPITALIDTCGEWKTAGKSNGPMGRVDSWVVTNTMWDSVISKIWKQSINPSIRPTIGNDMMVDGNGRRSLELLANRLNQDFSGEVKERDSSNLIPFDQFASVINRRLI